jgi:hypothetical protein
MALQKFTPGNCCGCAEGSCTIHGDAFTGTGAVPTGWDAPLSGAWARSADKLVTSSANAKILSSSSESFGGSVLSVTVGSLTIGAQAIILYRYVDSDHYSFARWEFAASEGILTLWQRVAGVTTQGDRAGPFFDELAEYHFPGRGAGTDTTLSICARSGVIVSVDDGHGFRSGHPLLVSGSGIRAGLATGVTGGDVTFDDFDWQHAASAYSHCPECLICQSCEEEQLCIAISGLAAPYDYFNGAHVTTRPGTCAWSKNVGQSTFGVFQLFGTIQAVAYRDEADLHYYLEVQLYDVTLTGGVPTLVARYRVDLGEDNPDCSAFEAVVLAWLDGESGTESATVTATTGASCTGSPVEETAGCCVGVTLPGIVYLTINGFTPDTPLGGGHVGVRIGYSGDDPAAFVALHEFGCSPQGSPLGSSPDFVALYIYRVGEATPIEMIMTIHSCSPFHASGDVPSHGWHGEITA